MNAPYRDNFNGHKDDQQNHRKEDSRRQGARPFETRFTGEKNHRKDH